jgi:pimeloyl-ACP methyl ester carboxylesterase
MSNKRLIFIHGFLETASMWKPILPHLSKSAYALQLPELPGHGNNSFIPEEKTAEAYCKNLIDQLSLSDNDSLFIVAHSMGGYLSATLATMIPNQISGLCLFHSKAGADSEQKIQDRKNAIEAAKGNKNLYVRTMITNIFFENNRERCKEEIEKQIIEAQGLSIEAITSAQQVMINRKDRVQDLRNRNFPLYYFLGDKDTSIPLDVALNEIEQLPGAVAHISQNTGHMGHIENKRDVVEFLQRIMRADI